MNIPRKGGAKECGALVPARYRDPTRVGDVMRGSGRRGRHDVTTTKGRDFYPIRGGIYKVLSIVADKGASCIKDVCPASVRNVGESRGERPWGPIHCRSGGGGGQGLGRGGGPCSQPA